MSDAVRAERRGHILEITLDRPKVNAIDRLTSVALGKAFVELRDDPELRVGIVTGAGDRIFSAGWDLKVAAEVEQVGKWWTLDYGPGSFAGLTELWDLNKPVIAAVNGHAIGGGFELAIACDLIVAAEHVDFALPELPIGILPDSGGLQRVPRRLPYNIAMELLLLGRRMTAQEAHHYGMVNTVVPKDQPLSKAREWAATLAEGAPLTIQAIKETLRAFEARPIRDCFELLRGGTLPSYERALQSEDAQEGMRAFVEKRKARFKGR
ncbi:MAG TPA: enoyl-CoA hydratase-related protein [Alphaproteobacteria bacterium]|nr:enoyl-CoA hydratase-related protein [Alphaproteobacteria bacterium]